MDTNEILNTTGNFTWFWNDLYLIETTTGNFIWSDPEYGGDDTIKPYSGSLMNFCRHQEVPYGRDTGTHVIRKCCPNAKYVNEEFACV